MKYQSIEELKKLIAPAGAIRNNIIILDKVIDSLDEAINILIADRQKAGRLMSSADYQFERSKITASLNYLHDLSMQKIDECNKLKQMLIFGIEAVS